MAMDINTKNMRQTIANNSVALHLHPIKKDYDELMEAIGPAQFVLIEFYRERALITRRLIEEKGFCCLGDFPDVCHMNNYVQFLKRQIPDTENLKDAKEALKAFTRFPLWMWRNHVVVHFLEWLKMHNSLVLNKKKTGNPVTIAGLDVYSLHRSAQYVVKFLEKIDPESAEGARKHYECFGKFGDNTMLYALASKRNIGSPCNLEVEAVLHALKGNMDEYLSKMTDTADNGEDEANLHKCLMNAHVVRGAEEYYRKMLSGDVESWNVRDDHMMDSLVRQLEWKTKILNRQPKVVIWAHNTHLGDARFTELGRIRKGYNLGQLLRQRFGEDNVYNVGLTTYVGQVTCTSSWGQQKIESKEISPAQEGSYEKFFHDLAEEYKMHNFISFFKKIEEQDNTVVRGKKVPTSAHPFPRLPDGKSFEDLPITSFPLERAIGAIYRPETERQSHYIEAFMSEQFDAVIHIDKTSALLGLDDSARKVGQEEENLPILFPFAV